jgi:hypothetical protein
MSEQEVISLRHYVETLFRAHEKEHLLLHEALARAEKLLDMRLDGMNQFRAQLDKQAATLATKESVTILQRFQDRFIGFLLGISALNALITYLIVKVMKNE